MISFPNVREFSKGLDTWIKAAEKELNIVYRGVAVEAFFKLLDDTPQWTGNAVANWNFSVGAIDTSVNFEFTGDYEESQAVAMSPKNVGFNDFSNIREAPEKQKGDLESIGFAIGRNRGKPNSATIWEPIYLSNSAESISGESYIMMLEDNPNSFLRKDNEPGQMVANTVKDLNKPGKLTDAEINKLKILGTIL